MLLRISKLSLKALIILLITTLMFVLLISSVALAEEEGEDNEYMDTTGIDGDSKAGGSGFFNSIFNSVTDSGDTTAEPVAEQSEIRTQEPEGAGSYMSTANIRLIDKTLGKLYKLEIPVGAKKNVNEMYIKVNKCWKPEAKTIVPEGRALIDVSEVRGKVQEKIFSGWIYAQSPSSSQLSHHKYDVTLASCSNASKAQPEAAQEDQPAAVPEQPHTEETAAPAAAQAE